MFFEWSRGVTKKNIVFLAILGIIFKRNKTRTLLLTRICITNILLPLLCKNVYIKNYKMKEYKIACPCNYLLLMLCYDAAYITLL